MSYIDIHTHNSTEHLAIISPLNWANFKSEEGQYYTAGIHPWQIAQMDGLSIKKLEELCKEPYVIAVGECGIDRAIDTPIDEQKELFEQQLQVAESYEMPLIIHSVRAYSDLLAIRKASKAKQAWIIHDYRGNAQQSQQLLQYPFYFSVGNIVLQDEHRAKRILQNIPLDRLFLETDAAQLSVVDIYKQAGALLQLPEQDLVEQIYKNFKTLFRTL